MRSSLTRAGDLPPPKSVTAAITRVLDLRREVDRIDLQLINPARVVKLGAGYGPWCRRALGAQRMLKKELQLLEVWLAERAVDAARLLVDARGVLRCLRRDDALEPDEAEVARRLDQFLDE